MIKSILILTNGYDLHADLLEKRLLKSNETVFRINLDKFPKEFEINYTTQYLSDYIFELVNHSTGQSILSNQIKSVWVRKSAEFSFLSNDLIPQEKEFAKEQTKHLLQGLINSLDCYWISHPAKLRASQWKLEQLFRAKKMGLTIPDSIATNHPTHAQDFFSKHQGKIITKPLGSSFVGADQVSEDDIVSNGISTTLLKPEDQDSLDMVKEVPCFFQAYIDKQFEVRATVVGNEIFCAKIDSQSDERTKIDYRDFSAEISYTPFELPKPIKQLCLDYVHSYDLEYGAIDLICTPQNDFVFLENNPVGQFWFIQQLVPELQIMEHLATCLIRGHR